MKVKIVNFLTGFVIFFVFATIIEFAVGWGMEDPWVFITVWAFIMALAEVFLLQPLRKRLKAKNNAVKK